ncbi:hypothetical protein F4827_003030 [Paraburkholderia bannensis]|uniref:Uncharacterized protein n=1 Tax=Paraburkholderia bannensis TaxID=765414 RepID=A0A7W9TZE5_9BURK|nr:hypothetical protein [Paraburkholderia sp. WP4_3_2]MBB6103175.1 hypothetical protein [Paraburkholderia bannensis]
MNKPLFKRFAVTVAYVWFASHIAPAGAVQ